MDDEGAWIDILVDSGAFAHVCPQSFVESMAVIPPDVQRIITTVSGEVLNHGSALVPLQLASGARVLVKFEVVDRVQKPILSVGVLNEK